MQGYLYGVAAVLNYLGDYLNVKIPSNTQFEHMLLISEY